PWGAAPDRPAGTPPAVAACLNPDPVGCRTRPRRPPRPYLRRRRLLEPPPRGAPRPADTRTPPRETPRPEEGLVGSRVIARSAPPAVSARSRPQAQRSLGKRGRTAG